MDSVALITTGVDGLAMAGAAALVGYTVIVIPVDEGPTPAQLGEPLRALAEARGAGRHEIESALARAWITPSLAGARHCALVIDCTEGLDLVARAHLLRRVEAHMSYGAILATADPSFERLAPALARPTQFLAIHRSREDDGRLEARETEETAPGAVEAVRLFCTCIDRASRFPTAA